MSSKRHNLITRTADDAVFYCVTVVSCYFLYTELGWCVCVASHETLDDFCSIRVCFSIYFSLSFFFLSKIPSLPLSLSLSAR